MINNSDTLKKKAIAFILLISLSSLFSDMTHAGAKSVYGAFLSLLGASAPAIGFISGMAQLAAHGLSIITGYIVDKKKNYWTMFILGYMFSLISIPALALISDHGWILAGGLIIIERIGKACWQPSRNTLISFASSGIGSGKSFSILSSFNKFGACLGPLILFLVLLFRHDSPLADRYHICFLILGIPAIVALLLTFLAKKRFGNPEQFESQKEENRSLLQSSRIFLLFGAGIFLFGLGLFDFPLITMHLAKNKAIGTEYLPLFFSGSMFVASVAALYFGRLFDKAGLRSLAISTFISSPFAFFIFTGNNIWMIMLGILIWGLGIGSLETIIKSEVTQLVSKQNRSKSFGIINLFFGVALFAGSWLCGIFYDISFYLLIIFSFLTQFLAAVLFTICRRMNAKN